MNEFYDTITRISPTRSNRYSSCQLLKDRESGDTILSTREIKEIPSSSKDIYHRVQSHERYRLDLIAHKYYKNPLLWWVIAQANDIYNPFEELEVGSLLRIPTIESLYGNNGILL